MKYVVWIGVSLWNAIKCHDWRAGQRQVIIIYMRGEFEIHYRRPRQFAVTCTAFPLNSKQWNSLLFRISNFSRITRALSSTLHARPATGNHFDTTKWRTFCETSSRHTDTTRYLGHFILNLTSLYARRNLMMNALT